MFHVNYLTNHSRWYLCCPTWCIEPHKVYPERNSLRGVEHVLIAQPAAPVSKCRRRHIHQYRSYDFLHYSFLDGIRNGCTMTSCTMYCSFGWVGEKTKTVITGDFPDKIGSCSGFCAQ